MSEGRQKNGNMNRGHELQRVTKGTGFVQLRGEETVGSLIAVQSFLTRGAEREVLSSSLCYPVITYKEMA